MMTTEFERHWWSLGLRGLLAVVFGLVSLIWPNLALGALVLLFGVCALADGVIVTIEAWRKQGSGLWWLLLLLGGIGVGLGIWALSLYGSIPPLLSYLVVPWAIITGLIEIIASLGSHGRLRMLAVGGVISVAFAVMLVMFPITSLVTMIWLIGAFALVIGILLMVIALQARALGQFKLVDVASNGAILAVK
jgi:uncharacterized membrane protein HdeD (DUF308 family)